MLDTDIGRCITIRNTAHLIRPLPDPAIHYRKSCHIQQRNHVPRTASASKQSLYRPREATPTTTFLSASPKHKLIKTSRRILPNISSSWWRNLQSHVASPVTEEPAGSVLKTIADLIPVRTFQSVAFPSGGVFL